MDRMRPPSRPRPAFWQHRATHRAAGAAEGMLRVLLGASAAGTNRKPSRIPQRPTAEHPAKRRLGAPAGSVCPLCFTPILQILSSCQESGVRRGTSPRMPKEQRKGRLLQPEKSATHPLTNTSFSSWGRRSPEGVRRDVSEGACGDEDAKTRLPVLGGDGSRSRSGGGGLRSRRLS